MTKITSLQQKLEQYSTTARGQTTHSLTAAEIAGYAAAGAAMAMAMAGAADASIIYSGVQNISVTLANPNATSTQKLAAIDIDGGGPDVNLGVLFQARTGNSSGGQPTFKYLGIGEIGPINGAKLLTAATHYGLPFVPGANLPVSAHVGAGGNFASAGAGILVVLAN